MLTCLRLNSYSSCIASLIACETLRKSNFLKKKWQNGNFDQNSEFFYISDDEMDFTVEIVSRNLATTSNFFKFRDSQNSHVFRGNERSARHLAHFEWLTVCHVSGAE